jgi:tetratricopeptide (TPR) repeat protein
VGPALTSPDVLSCPFPGLRPFEPDEDHLFFGREREIDELLRRLRFNRFLSIVGTSGSGKSSLIRCGLISALQGGMMARAGSSWRVSIFRPGEDPVRALAAALDAPDVLGSTDAPLASPNRVLIEAALGRGPRGLIDAVRHAGIPPDDNVLIVVDQFEELFRFRRTRSRDEGVSFVKLLLEAVSQSEVPIYVVITMRSDFIGDCMDYPGLAEALNQSQYLVPRMTRDALRSVIAGPVAVAGASMAPRLVLRLLNDLGTDQDQLPVLQHALMRTWEHWALRREPDAPIDVHDYEAVGTLREALSRHAEEAYAETGSERGRSVAERMFKALTDTVTDPRGTRRPCSVAELSAIVDAEMDEIRRVIEIFRRPGRSFLMPPAAVALDGPVVVDISHESLMRCWTRLIAWADEERLSAAMYMRLSKAAGWHEERSGGLWRDPELELGLRWRQEHHPTAAWAQRYAEPFERAMHFLDRSAEERDRLVAERRAEKRKQWRQLQWTAAMLAALLMVTAVLALVASRQGKLARDESARAEENLRLARAAVDESLLVAEREPSRLAADFPELVTFRRQLLERAQQFYLEFTSQAPADEEIRGEMGIASLRLAHIDRALASRERASTQYRYAIDQLEEVVRLAPDRPEYRQALASAYNWYGEMLRLSGTQFDAARHAYDRALDLQQDLADRTPGHGEYQRDLARTHYNRGILYREHAAADGAFELAEIDFQRAIGLLEPLAGDAGDVAALQELGRAYNNLGSLLADDMTRAAEALQPFTRAVDIHEGLLMREPGNREYALELVQFYNNDAELLREFGRVEEATSRNRQALALLDDLSRPAPSVSIQRADNHIIRGRIAQATNAAASVAAYRQALITFEGIQPRERTAHLPDFPERLGELLENVVFLVGDRPETASAPELLGDVLDLYLAMSRQAAEGAAPAAARSVLTVLPRVLPQLPDPMRAYALETFEEIEPGLRSGAASE